MEKSENYRDNPHTSAHIVLACDATKDRNTHEFKNTITNIRMQGGIIQAGDKITVLGVVHKILHPMGYQMKIGHGPFFGTHVRAMKEEFSRKIDSYVSMLHHSAEECEADGVEIKAKITVGGPMTKVVAKEVATSNATWVVLDRHLRKELKFYLKHTPCKVALVLDDLSLEVLRPYYSNNDIGNVEHTLFYSLSKPVEPLSDQDNETIADSVFSVNSYESVSALESSNMTKNSSVSVFTPNSNDHSFSSQDESCQSTTSEKSGNDAKVENKYVVSLPMMQKQRSPQISSDSLTKMPKEESIQEFMEYHSGDESIFTAKQEKSGSNAEGENKYAVSPPMMEKQRSSQRSTDMPILSTSNWMNNGLDSIRFCYSKILIATDNFSSDNLLGEGRYGVVYKGQLKDGQLITAKVLKEASTRGSAEFHSEVYALSFARHKNIVMLLGYCCKENLNVLVYEYICNKSLEWHLFDNADRVLEWHQRRSIAIGIAQGLRYLHEKCRGCPIIHQNVRPSQILLTHDFVPMLGDCGLAKWKTDEADMQTQILGTLGYLAPEYTENGDVTVQTDVYAFGVVLIQLISGHRIVDSPSDNHQQSIIRWALPLVQTLALDGLVDPRLGDSYRMYELYHMARTACLCVQTDPTMRPSMGEVLHLLDGKHDHFLHSTETMRPWSRIRLTKVKCCRTARNSLA
ncbi:Protein kinase protein with adenine nucleotide alpha hydrolase-like domain [Forsythia ovata]|uniref:Protein kinase protein with adenine nucleotide alpha hydrolase-like domain n=1 Tax=Forsythia ovata TaxID=205694 RepID=A0ABD1PWS1_9LAMI